MKHDLLFSLYLFGRHIRQMVPSDHGEKMLTGTILWLLQSNEQSLSELAVRLSAQPSTISEKITQLENEGLVERTSSQDDRRGKHISITPKGEAALQPMLTLMDGNCAASVEALTEDEQHLFGMLLTKLIKK